jgi:hypothetical protein
MVRNLQHISVKTKEIGMKKIINKKMYNTETAIEVATSGNGLPSSELGSYSEALFVTKKGVYFLWGEGGPMSKYVISFGNDLCGSEDIQALTKEAAYNWLEENQCFGAIEKYFSELIEDA